MAPQFVAAASVPSRGEEEGGNASPPTGEPKESEIAVEFVTEERTDNEEVVNGETGGGGEGEEEEEGGGGEERGEGGEGEAEKEGGGEEERREGGEGEGEGREGSEESPPLIPKESLLSDEEVDSTSTTSVSVTSQDRPAEDEATTVMRHEVYT